MTGAGNNVLRKIAGARKGERSFRNGTEIPTQVKHSYNLSDPNVRNHFQNRFRLQLKDRKRLWMHWACIRKGSWTWRSV